MTGKFMVWEFIGKFAMGASLAVSSVFTTLAALESQTQLEIAVGGLAAAVVTLFIWFRNDAAETKKRLRECEQDRAMHWKKIIELEERDHQRK